ncbi:protein prenyltransferase alpha subunit repeat-containing protein 1 [Anopheles aquasalis]|uniref:protein prenyltransferase alpha subunit repeat-containing protein 1 n=1 Tax=Anopheles aquasalis TaxID=42839 RepID=UPI00215B218D|nr:protein prenyltransferase alpha subunit repeat-containing protein 1 [Anopheles aquasalis]
MGQDEEDAAFCEKIINEIDAVFVRDPELVGFEIIPMPLNQNKSPVIHVEHNLGLQSWCVPFIYTYAHRLILRYRNEWLLSNTLPTGCGSGCWSATDKGKLSMGGGSAGNGAGSSLHGNSSSGSGSGSTSGALAIIKYLNCAILINPDVATFWNLRRQLFAKNRLDISKEFHFSTLVLSKKPKSNEAFAYRRWLYLFQSCDAIDWSFEISLCEKCADKSTTNYHAWSHRQWVLMKDPQLLRYEVYKTEKFIRKHIHDYSCYNHRQFVLERMFEQCYYDADDDEEGDVDSGADEADEGAMVIGRRRRKYGALCSLIESLTGTGVPYAQDFSLSVRNLLCYLLPALATKDLDQLNQLHVQTFLFCANAAAYDLRMCEELSALHSPSQALVNHRRSMVKFLIEKLRLAPAWLVKATNEPQASPTFQQPLSKMTRLDADADDGPLLRALQAEELRRTVGDPRHAQWCSSFLGIQ